MHSIAAAAEAAYLKCRKIVRRSLRQAQQPVMHFISASRDASAKIIILAYHRVLPNPVEIPFSSVVTVNDFKRQIDRIARAYPVVPLTEAVRQCRSGSPRSPLQVVLTFDDGYRDNYEYVLPILRSKGLVATFFVPAGCVGSGRPLWEWELVTALTSPRAPSSLSAGGRTVHRSAFESRRSFALRVFRSMKGLDCDERERSLRELRDAASGTDPASEMDRIMTWDELRSMAGAGMEIGSHGLFHRPLAFISTQEAVREIRESRDEIAKEIGSYPKHFALPFGSRDDFTAEQVRAVREAGYDSCLSTLKGYNRVVPSADPFRRIIMEGWSDPRFLLS